MLLALVDQGLQHFTLGREPEAVVDQFRIARHDAVFQMASAAIEGDLFNPAMGFQQNGAAGGFIDPARFHPDKAVLHQIEATHAVLAAQLVQLGQDGRRAHRFAVDRHGIAPLEGDFHHFGLIGRIFGGDGALIDVIGGLIARIFQNLALGRGVQQVCIDREGGLTALVLGNRNLVRFSEFQKLGAA